MKNLMGLRRVKALGALVSTTSLVIACGGGGGGSDDPPATSVTVSGKAVDGPLQGVTACYDLNDNYECDSGEPTSAATGADGAFTISGIAIAEGGKHAVLVDVPPTAIDADTGAAVDTPFIMVAPATSASGNHSVFVSPLTTLVVLQQGSTAQTLAEATAFVQSQLGLAVSPLADFTASSNADNVKAANAARLTRSAQTQQGQALAAAVGQTDISGVAVTQDDVDELASTSLLGSLPAIGASAIDASLQGQSGTALRDAIAALAAVVVAQNGPTVPEAVAAIGVGKLPPDPGTTATPTAGASLAALRYTSASDWYMRSFQATATDSTPDADGLVRNYEVRSRVDAANPGGITWGFNNDYNRAGDRYWNGSIWRTCDLGTRSSGTQRDATGRSYYNYCDNHEKGTSVRSGVDIAGQTLVSVLTDRIRTVPGGSAGVNFADWGPADLSLLGAATFPADSKLFYQTTTPLEAAYAYDARDTNFVTVYSQAVANGGDGRTGPAPACYEANLVPTPTTSLEDMAARTPGRPCIGGVATNADGNSLDPNEGWWNSTLSMGNVAGYFTSLPAGTGNFYTNEARMRVAFTGVGNGTNYYACYVRRTASSTRNCQLLGSGTYTVTTLGDGRVMSFNNVPAAFSRITFERVFVERGGAVYFGYRNRVGASFAQVRLNMPAANAMLSQLGLPVIAPTDPQ